MGTNFYLRPKNEISADNDIHIGKSSYGWRFALHYIPKLAESIEQWQQLYNNPNYKIIDEYDSELSPDDLDNIILCRGKQFPDAKDGTFPYTPIYTLAAAKNIERQENCQVDYSTFLIKHTIPSTLSANPDGITFDLISGDFS